MEEPSQAEEETAPLLTPGLLYTPRGAIVERQVAYDRIQLDLYAILYLVADETAALLVASHAYDERGTRGDGQKERKGLEGKYLRVVNKTPVALQEALSATYTWSRTVIPTTKS